MDTVKTIKISHFGGGRGADELVIYDGSGRTGTNPYGVEAAVLDGVVISFGSNDKAVPEGGFVVSGHGAGAAFIREYLFEGAKAEIDRKSMTLKVTAGDAERISYCAARIKQLKERAAQNGRTAESAAHIKRAESLAGAKRFEECAAVLEEAYYLTAASKKGETRAIWHRPLEQSAAEIDAGVKRLADAGINILLIETIYDSYSIGKRADMMPLRPDLVGKDFDMIDEFLKAGKKYGVSVQAWVEDFFVGSGDKATETSCGSPIIDLHPDWVAKKKDGSIYMRAEPGFIYLNAALPEVRAFLRDMYKQLLDEYAFDGIQLDYIRYPLTPSVEESVGFDDYSVQRFKEASGIDIREVNSVETPEWREFLVWRSENVTAFVKSMYELISEYKKSGRPLVLSTAVFGNQEEAMRLKSQNWSLWCGNGWIDCIYPMAYLNDASDVGDEVRKMVERYPSIPNISGLSPMYSRLPVIESTKQVEACREAGAAGVAFFETKMFTDVQIEKLRLGVFRE